MEMKSGQVGTWQEGPNTEVVVVGSSHTGDMPMKDEDARPDYMMRDGHVGTMQMDQNGDVMGGGRDMPFKVASDGMDLGRNATNSMGQINPTSKSDMVDDETPMAPNL